MIVGSMAMVTVLCRLAFCTCVPGGTISQAIHSADAVIEAVPLAVRDTALKIKADGGASGTWRQRVYTMLVQRQWKGAQADTVQVMTGTGGGDCGYRFELGVPYLVFAAQGTPYLATSTCSRTKPARESREERRVLGESH